MRYTIRNSRALYLLVGWLGSAAVAILVIVMVELFPTTALVVAAVICSLAIIAAIVTGISSFFR